LNPISDPTLDANGRLTFVNAAVDADVARIPFGYRAVWSRFDNATRASEKVGETSDRIPSIRAPHGLPQQEGVLIKVEISAAGSMYPTWETPVDAYFRRLDGPWKLIGFERMPER
jgi:hypothetical protein